MSLSIRDGWIETRRRSQESPGVCRGGSAEASIGSTATEVLMTEASGGGGGDRNPIAPRNPATKNCKRILIGVKAVRLNTPIAIAHRCQSFNTFFPNVQQKAKTIAVTTGEIPKNKASTWGKP